MNTSAVPPLIQQGEQKLVSIYLDNTAYAKGRAIVGSFADKHGLVEEHLAEFFKDGWKVMSIHGMAGGSEALAVRGWVIVLLERS
jgi:hypothetical protein